MNDKAGRKAGKLRFDWKNLVFSAVMPVSGMLIALLIGAVMLLFLNVNPITAYGSLIAGAVGNLSGLTQTLVKATPLLLVGLGICIAFRASVINIGGEGQIIAGALAGTWFPLTFRDWPGFALIPLTLLVGFLAGALWGFIPGVLKARLKVNEILSTVMMNAIALQLMNLLIHSVLMDPAGISAGTYLPNPSACPNRSGWRAWSRRPCCTPAR